MIDDCSVLSFSQHYIAPVSNWRIKFGLSKYFKLIMLLIYYKDLTKIFLQASFIYYFYLSDSKFIPDSYIV